MSEATSRAAALLATPLGIPGSGRVRYGAAMELWRAGEMTLADLEAYRVCASLDGEDPAKLSVTPPQAPGPDRAAAIRAAVAAIDDYLAALPGPGIGEVRAGIAAHGGGAVTPAGGLRPPPRALLGPALAALTATHPALALAIETVAPHLDWPAYDLYPPEEIGPAFAGGHAFANLIDPGGPIAAPDFCLGLFVIAPHVLYRDHCHPAPELYAPLTGPHGWRFRPGAPLTSRPAHDPVWNEPCRPHATKVGAVPFLAVFGWTRDVNEPARVLPAPDWAELEQALIPLHEPQSGGKPRPTEARAGTTPARAEEDRTSPRAPNGDRKGRSP